jgi:hypothetical protein
MAVADFKSAVAADIKGVFLNPREFGEPHMLAFGKNAPKEIVCAVDEDLIDERQSRKQASEFAEGVFKTQKVIFVDAADLSARPVQDENCYLDGKRYKVDDCADDMGVYRITIGANDQ